MGSAFHLAQLNIGIIRAPLDSAQLAPFVEALDLVNATADGAPGFVWRLQTDEGDATAIRPFDDPDMLVNMSVWASLPDLRAFVYTRPEHVSIMRRRREFFERMDVYLVLWWIPAGHIPTVDEAKLRLERLRALGPTPQAFTFRHHFPAPDADEVQATVDDDDRWLCPA